MASPALWLNSWFDDIFFVDLLTYLVKIVNCIIRERIDMHRNGIYTIQKPFLVNPVSKHSPDT